MERRSPGARAVVGAVLLAVLAAAIVVGVRWALDPDTIRREAEARLQRAIGQPVSIGEMRVSWLPRPALVGSDIRIGDAPDEAPGLSVDTLRIVPDLWSIIRRPLVIHEIVLQRLVVSVLRDEKGAWHAPVAVPVADPGPDGTRQVEIHRVRVGDGVIRLMDRRAGVLRERGRITAVETELLVDEDRAVRLSPLLGRVGEAMLEGEARVADGVADVEIGLEEVRDADLSSLLALAGTDRPGAVRLPHPAAIAMQLRIDAAAGAISGTGAIRAPEVAMGDLRLHRLEAPVALKQGTVTLAPATFGFHDGRHEGTITLLLDRTPARWSTDSRIAELDVGGLLDALAGRDQRLDARGRITAAVGGAFGEPLTALEGHATVGLDRGVIRDFPLLAAVNRAVRLAETEERDTRFERLTGTFSFGGGVARTEDLRLDATGMRVELAGRIGFDRTLDLTGLAVLTPDRTAAAVRSVRELVALRSPRGELELPLSIGGTLDDPAFSVDLKAAAGKILQEELRRRLLDIIR